jgi:DNA modification methylase
MLPPDGLKPAKRNAKTHSEAQIDLLVNSLVHFGVVRPVVVDNRGRIVAGHGVWLAAKKLGLKLIPVIRVSHLSETQLRAYALADNQLATKSGWDRELLSLEFGDLQIALPEIGLDLTMLGFDTGEIDSVFEDFGDGATNPADEIPEIDDGPAVSQLGDVFVMGRHRLLVGDARDPDAYQRLMQGEVAEMGIHDPPYNVRIQGNVGGRGRIKRREFACASGEMDSPQFIAFLKATLGPCARHSLDGAIHYVCVDWRHVGELIAAGTEVFDDLKNMCVWVKSNAGQGSFYRSQHELVLVFKHGHAPHLNNFGLGAGGRTRSNVWRYAGVNSFRAGRMDELKMHPTVKPVAMIADAIRDCSRRGSIVLDAFAGSGTTIMAAEQLGRRAFCMEIDPRYADVAIRRWQAVTKRDAVLEATGQTFDQLSKGKVRAGAKSRRRK